MSSFYEDAAGGKKAGPNLMGSWEFGMRLSEEMRELILKRIETEYPSMLEPDGAPTTDTLKQVEPFTALTICVTNLQRWVQESVKRATKNDPNDPFAKVLALVQAALLNEDPAASIAAMAKVMGRDK